MDCDDISSSSSNFSDDDCSDVVRKITHMNQPSRITFKLRVTEHTSSIWETVLHPANNILYVALPSVLVPEASKQSFITLLEFAEEKLQCSAIVLCVRKDRSDRKNLVRTFMFLGFQVLSPNSELAPQNVEDDNLFFIYKIEE
jgi:ornithine decarboxylase antizyme 1